MSKTFKIYNKKLVFLLAFVSFFVLSSAVYAQSTNQSVNNQSMVNSMTKNNSNSNNNHPNNHHSITSDSIKNNNNNKTNQKKEVNKTNSTTPKNIKTVEQNIKKKFPHADLIGQPKKVSHDLYQIWFDGQLAYTDKNIDYMLTGGNLVNVKNKTNLTKKAYKERTNNAFQSLPLKNSIKVQYGNGKHKIAVFIDPKCPYCQNFEQMLNRNKKDFNLTVYYFWLPLESVHPGTTKRAIDIECSKNPKKAMLANYLRNKKPKNNQCQEGKKIVHHQRAIAHSLGMHATPYILFRDNKSFEGALPKAGLKKALRYVSHQMKKKNQ